MEHWQPSDLEAAGLLVLDDLLNENNFLNLARKHTKRSTLLVPKRGLRHLISMSKGLEEYIKGFQILHGDLHTARRKHMAAQILEKRDVLFAVANFCVAVTETKLVSLPITHTAAGTHPSLPLAGHGEEVRVLPVSAGSATNRD